jgi:hypothetical protein
MPGRALLLAFAIVALLPTREPVQASEVTACFPSCQPDDGRFLALIGSARMQTLSGMPISVRFEPPRPGRPFEIEVFDSDMRYQDTVSSWDHLNVYDSQRETRTLYTVSPCLDSTCSQLTASCC